MNIIIKIISAIILILLFISFSGCTDNEILKNKVDKRPNFLFIFSDDQTYKSINSINNSEVITPNIDKLAESGIVFTHCFNQGSWSGAVCIPSRAMLNSGQFLFSARTGINKNQLWGETFTIAGYETFLTGKWHNGDSTALRSFKYAKSIGKGMYETLHHEFGRDPGYNRPTAENNFWKPWDTAFTGHWSPNVKDIIYDENGSKLIGTEYRVKQHTSELYADNAIEFLNTNVKNSDAPFFMYVSFNAPHDPRQSPKKYIDMYPPENIEVPNNFLPEHPFDQGDHKLRDELLAPFPRTEKQIQVHRSEYYSIITHMDHQIGRIINALEQTGKADNTYIIFSSDHGLAVGQHGLMGKQNQYDHSIRMPLIMAGPGIRPGAFSDALVYLQSLYATTCEFAGLMTPMTVDFPSLKGIIDGETDFVHDAIYGSYRNFQRMIRTENYKLIMYPHNGVMQLFNLQTDPDEIYNLINEPTYEPVKTELFARFQKLQKEVGDTLKIVLKKD